MTICSYTHYVPIVGLYLITFYNPARLYRQYGQRQSIPQLMPEFESGPLTQNFLDNLAVTWPRRTIQRGINYNEDPSTDHYYKEWVHLQQTEQDEFVRLWHTRNLQALNFQNMAKRGRHG